MPIELELPSLQTVVRHGLGETKSIHNQILMLKKLDEMRRSALQHYEIIQL